jgi:hypothetical protein
MDTNKVSRQGAKTRAEPLIGAKGAKRDREANLAKGTKPQKYRTENRYFTEDLEGHKGDVEKGVKPIRAVIWPR